MHEGRDIVLYSAVVSSQRRLTFVTAAITYGASPYEHAVLVSSPPPPPPPGKTTGSEG